MQAVKCMNYYIIALIKMNSKKENSSIPEEFSLSFGLKINDII